MCGYGTCIDKDRDVTDVPKYECECNAGYNIDISTGKCTQEKVCDAYNFGTGVEGYGSSTPCNDGVQLSSISNNNCLVKCMTGYHEVAVSTTEVTDSSSAGGWGGSCTCPDGTTYQVGDNYDYCGSLRCINGAAGTCNRFVDASWSHKSVTCGSSNTVRCVDGTLLAMFTCEPNSCDSEPNVINANPSCAGTASFARCSFLNCATGYTMSASPTCNLGEWDLTGVRCDANACTSTQVSNSDKSITNSISGVTGTTVTVNCHVGYSGSGDVSCQSNGQFSPTRSCVANTCTSTQVSNSNYKTLSSISGVTGETRNVVCDAGYSGGGLAECLTTGMFERVFFLALSTLEHEAQLHFSLSLSLSLSHTHTHTRSSCFARLTRHKTQVNSTLHSVNQKVVTLRRSQTLCLTQVRAPSWV
jgi:hypothetical protein